MTERQQELKVCQALMRAALRRAKNGKAPRTADKIRSALKSVDGAIRHCDGDPRRANKGNSLAQEA